MLGVLQVEDVRTKMSLWNYDDSEQGVAVKCNAGSYIPPLNQFLYLRIRVTNLSSAFLFSIIRVMSRLIRLSL